MFCIKSFRLQNNVKTSNFHPLWLTGYSGFDMRPYISSVSFAIGAEDGYWYWNDEGWGKTDSPVFYSSYVIRDRIDKLPPGKIYFQSSQPYSGEIRLGYYLSGSLVDYLLDFALPEYTKKINVDIIRWVEVYDGQLEVSVPNGLDIPRIRKARILGFQGNNQVGYVNQELGTIVFQDTLQQGDARLIIDYELEIISAVDQGTYQIASLPSVGLIPIPPGSIRYDLSGCSEFVEISEGVGKESVVTWQQSQLLEVVVFSSFLQESRLIAQALMKEITANGQVYLPPFDCSVYLKVNSEIEIEKKYSNIKGNVRTCKFELMIANLLEG